MPEREILVPGVKFQNPLFPGPKEPPQDQQLSKVVGIVIGHQEGLPQNRLPIPVRDAR